MGGRSKSEEKPARVSNPVPGLRPVPLGATAAVDAPPEFRSPLLDRPTVTFRPRYPRGAGRGGGRRTRLNMRCRLRCQRRAAFDSYWDSERPQPPRRRTDLTPVPRRTLRPRLGRDTRLPLSLRLIRRRPRRRTRRLVLLRRRALDFFDFFAFFDFLDFLFAAASLRTSLTVLTSPVGPRSIRKENGVQTNAARNQMNPFNPGRLSDCPLMVNSAPFFQTLSTRVGKGRPRWQGTRAQANPKRGLDSLLFTHAFCAGPHPWSVPTRFACQLFS